jgi:hypothetical protein
LSTVSSFSSEEILSVMLIFVRISEIDFQKWATSSWIMKNGSDDTLNISFSFNKIEISISWRCDSLWFRSGINATNLAFSLAWD